MRRTFTVLIHMLVLFLGAELHAQEVPTSAPSPAPPTLAELKAKFSDEKATDLERRQALARMAAFPDDDVVPFLFVAFKNEPVTAMQAAILNAIAAHPKAAGVEDFIHEQVSSAADFMLQSAAMRALPLVSNDWKNHFRKLLADDTRKTLHSTIVFTITYSGDDGTLDFLEEILKSKSESLGALVISYATAKFGIEATFKDFLQPYLRKQAEEALRFAAIAALGQAKDKRFLSSLNKYLSRQDREKTGNRWLPLLAGLDEPAAFQVMLEIVEQPQAATLVDRAFCDAAEKMADPQTLAWFRERGAKHKETFIRRAAIASMTAHPDAKNVAALKKLAEGDDGDLAGGAINALAKHPRDAVEEILKKLMRHSEVQRASDAMESWWQTSNGEEAFVVDLIEIAGHSRAWELRVVAMRLIQEQHAGRARDVLLKNATHDRGAVRIAAYEALTYLRSKETVDFLIERLRHEDGRPVGELTAALTNLTGSQWGRRVERWQEWWSRVRDEYPLPPRPAQALVRGDDNDDGSRYGFYGIDVDSKRVVFVIDNSGSMSARSNTGTTDRLYQAKNELTAALSRFGDGHLFDIIAFTQTPKPYAGSLVKATRAELDKAKAWIDALTATGGTNIYDSLVLALETPDVDTIFLLSDGSPGSGKLVDTDLILDAIRRMNRFRRIKINAIGIGVAGEARRLVEELAKQNWGRSVIL